MNQRILIKDDTFELEWLLSTAEGQIVLNRLHQGKQRLRCACVAGGIEMYISRRGARYYVSRMPGSGSLHDSACKSVEDNNYLTGATAYDTETIVENTDGVLVVAYQEGLSKGDRLSQLGSAGLFDLLIEQANLNRHHHRPVPVKITWAATRDRLLKAAQTIVFRDKLDGLIDHLAVPDAFDKENSSAAQESFCKRLEQIDRAMICAPLKELKQSQFGWLLLLKHLPNIRFWVSQEVIKSTEICSAGQFLLHSLPRYALCFGEVHKARKPGNFIVSSLCVRTTDASFMPCSNDIEAEVANQLRAEGLSFLRPLRFDAPVDIALADYALLDEAMTPVFVSSPTGSQELDAARRALAGVFERNGANARIFPFH